MADGDTFTLLTASNQQVKIRLWGIDTPERKRAFGTKARQFTSSLVFGKQVAIETKDTDRYGRTLGVTFVADKNVNLEIVKSGMGWWYRQYATEASDFEKAEKQAQEKRIGLWVDPDPIAPWEFRKTRRRG